MRLVGWCIGRNKRVAPFIGLSEQLLFFFFDPERTRISSFHAAILILTQDTFRSALVVPAFAGLHATTSSSRDCQRAKMRMATFHQRLA